VTDIGERLAVLEALSRALADLPRLLSLLGECDDRAEAEHRLQEAYGFAELEARVVLDTQFGLLTRGGRAAVGAEIRELRYGLEAGWDPPLEVRAAVRSPREAELVLGNGTHRVEGEDVDDTLLQLVSVVRERLAGPERRRVAVTTDLADGPIRIVVDPVGGARFLDAE
jgi:hypothetical protein